MNGPYDDIIGLPHHVSSVHPQMSMYSRAAQFAPFSALTGHEEAIRETARLRCYWFWKINNNLFNASRIKYRRS